MDQLPLLIQPDRRALSEQIQQEGVNGSRLGRVAAGKRPCLPTAAEPLRKRLAEAALARRGDVEDVRMSKGVEDGYAARLRGDRLGRHPRRRAE